MFFLKIKNKIVNKNNKVLIIFFKKIILIINLNLFFECCLNINKNLFKFKFRLFLLLFFFLNYIIFEQNTSIAIFFNNIYFKTLVIRL